MGQDILTLSGTPDFTPFNYALVFIMELTVWKGFISIMEGSSEPGDTTLLPYAISYP